VPRDHRLRFYLGLDCAATVAPVGAAAYIIWKTGGLSSVLYKQEMLTNPAGFGCKDTGYALSLLGATGLGGLLLIPGFMNKNLTWVSFNT
jgi:hypothetical protein